MEKLKIIESHYGLLQAGYILGTEFLLGEVNTVTKTVTCYLMDINSKKVETKVKMEEFFTPKTEFLINRDFMILSPDASALSYHTFSYGGVANFKIQVLLKSQIQSEEILFDSRSFFTLLPKTDKLTKTN